MNTVQKCLFGGALLGAGLSNTAMADIHIADTIELYNVIFGYDSGSGGLAQGDLEIHTIDFTVLTDGNVQIDMLSWGVFDAYFDTQIRLFNNDGNPLSNGNQVGSNDDGPGGFDFNGSVSNFDSFLDIFLTAGEYTVAVSALAFSADDAEAGVNIATIWSSVSQATAETGGQYEMDIYGDVSLPGVPTPGALALLGLGGLVSTRRRR